jgi:RNA polymerase sigma-70 factor, ECF subfamily
MTDDQDELLKRLLGCRGMLLGYVTAIVRSAELAEDVFQNVALVVLKKGDRSHLGDGFPAWARGIARREALAALRKQAHTPQLLNEALLDLLEDRWQANAGAGHGTVSEALHSCLQKLTPRARSLIELRFQENLSGKEMAARLAQPVNTVYVALSRIYRNLASCIRQRLAAEGSPHG